MRARRLGALMLALLTASLLLASCGASPLQSRPAAEVVAPPSLEEYPSSTDGLGARQPVPAATAAPGASDLGEPERLIVKTGDLAVTVKDVETAVSQVRTMAAQYGGYVVNVNTWSIEDESYATISIRIPAEQFDRVMQEIGDISEKVERSSSSGTDVTEEYYDLEARLRALRATEEQLLLLLGDVRERMKSAEDILAVYRELQNVQSQIEQLEGRRRYLEQNVAMSTLSVSLSPVGKELPVITGEWKPFSTLKDAVRALTGTGRTLLDAMIWILFYLVPLLAIILIPIAAVILLLRAVLRRRKRTPKP